MGFVMGFKIIEFAFVQRFWSKIEKSSVNPYMLQISKIISFTMKLDLVDRDFSLSEFFVVRDLSVYIYI